MFKLSLRRCSCLDRFDRDELCSKLILHNFHELDQAHNAWSHLPGDVLDFELIIRTFKLSECNAVCDCQHDCADLLVWLKSTEINLIDAVDDE